jgi:hypothetical protein
VIFNTIFLKNVVIDVLKSIATIRNKKEETVEQFGILRDQVLVIYPCHTLLLVLSSQEGYGSWIFMAEGRNVDRMMVRKSSVKHMKYREQDER